MAAPAQPLHGYAQAQGPAPVGAAQMPFEDRIREEFAQELERAKEHLMLVIGPTGSNVGQVLDLVLESRVQLQRLHDQMVNQQQVSDKRHADVITRLDTMDNKLDMVIQLLTQGRGPAQG